MPIVLPEVHGYRVQGAVTEQDAIKEASRRDESSLRFDASIDTKLV